MINSHPPIAIAQETAPQLIVVIDTEEEFDWSSQPDKNSNSVTAMEKIHLVQDIFDEYQIQPCYVIDYPIASQAIGYEPLLEIYQQGHCEIGAHLHPWVNPPFEEELTISNMYPGNLGRQLEYVKLKNLSEQIKNIFDFSPTIYKAGRYGVRENTTEILAELGFDIDLSICTSYDYSADGGPDFSNAHAEPFWFGSDNQILEIPLSGAFVGSAGSLSKNIYNLAGHLDFIKARGILSRLNIVDRLMLSPEGYTTKEHIKLTKFLYNKGVRTFTWNFHSPTVVPGMTAYTQTQKELTVFLDSFRYFFDFFFTELNGTATTPTQLKQTLRQIMETRK